MAQRKCTHTPFSAACSCKPAARALGSSQSSRHLHERTQGRHRLIGTAGNLKLCERSCEVEKNAFVGVPARGNALLLTSEALICNTCLRRGRGQRKSFSDHPPRGVKRNEVYEQSLFFFRRTLPWEGARGFCLLCSPSCCSGGRPPQVPPVVSTRGARFHLRSPNRALWAGPSPPVDLRLREEGTLRERRRRRGGKRHEKLAKALVCCPPDSIAMG